MAYMSHNPAHSVSRYPSPLAMVASFANALIVWTKVSQERARLRDMGLSRLDDLGLSEADVKRETRKPFWWTRRSA